MENTFTLRPGATLLRDKSCTTTHYATLDDLVLVLMQADMFSIQVKASILKETGDLTAAADALESGRQLDLADRFTNCLSAKYLLAADQDERAEEVVSLFTKHEGDTRTNLFEMQCMWYEIAAGNCALRKGKMALALKCFLSVERHFKDFVEDQFDFHSYCLRKVTLRSYIGTCLLAIL